MGGEVVPVDIVPVERDGDPLQLSPLLEVLKTLSGCAEHASGEEEDRRENLEGDQHCGLPHESLALCARIRTAIESRDMSTGA